MIKIEDLKRKYDGVNINELENAAKGNQHEMREAQVEMVKILYYLECTKRYKENKRYAKATFGEYVDGMFALREGTYREWKRAILHWEEEVLKHGVGLPAKVVSFCGSLKAPKIFAEIDKIIADAKKDGPSVRDKIEKLIYGNSKKISKSVTDYKAMYEREFAAHEITKAKLKEAGKIIVELREQISRLKHSLRKK